MADARKTGRSQKATPAKKAATAARKPRGAAAKAKAGGKSRSATGGRKGSTSRQKPPARKRAVKLSLLDRVHRAREIAEMRARAKPLAWREIAKRVGLSESQARDVYADYLRWDETRKDPMAVVDETIDAMWSAMIEASDNAAHAAPGSPARTGAIKAFLEAATTRLALMQAAGQVPRYLGTFQAERELRTVLQEFADLLRRHEVGDGALRDFLELAERVQSRRTPAAVPAVIEGAAA